MDLKSIKVGVLAGGVSSEREVSLVSAQRSFDALLRQGINAVLIDVNCAQPSEVKALLMPYALDLAFIALHGEFGEDGKIQAILEELGIEYTGSDPKASYLAMDKLATKKIFSAKNVPSPRYQSLSQRQELKLVLSYPIVVKPYLGGSSIGVSIVHDQSMLSAALALAFKYNDQLIIEEYIPGKELTVGILEQKPLAVVEIVPRQGYYDYQNKYSDNKVDYIAPAQLAPRLYSRCQEIAFLAHQVLGCRDFSRVDLRVNPRDECYVLEVNSIPGLTSHSLLPLSAKCNNIDFDNLIIKMLQLALNRRVFHGQK